ncbi:hypothetical protein [Streptomyces aidingensis]|uniref:Secreted protein n=1 Tax=Streptomyces aidingensis TaxID=910347 RepID=A0A1I1E3L6_9ACTN|nr:hypothetical protein [Streptomyces aidingensis]SFB81246.1 hypothetical protein SAMN05421773_10188 [Streptomyces aidingensis]
MRRSVRLAGPVALAAAGVLLLGACGGDGDDGNNAGDSGGSSSEGSTAGDSGGATGGDSGGDTGGTGGGSLDGWWTTDASAENPNQIIIGDGQATYLAEEGQMVCSGPAAENHIELLCLDSTPKAGVPRLDGGELTVTWEDGGSETFTNLGQDLAELENLLQGMEGMEDIGGIEGMDLGGN